MRIPATLITMLPLLTGCHVYRPVTVDSAPMGTAVAIDLTDRGTADLGRLLGSGVDRVTGELLNVTERELRIAVRSARQADGIENFWKGEQVTLPRESVARVQERRLSKVRSGALSAALVAAAVAIWQGLGSFGGSPESGNGGQTR